VPCRARRSGILDDRARAGAGISAPADGVQRTDDTRDEEATTGMKPEIHPEYHATTVTCGCGNTFTTRSTVPSGSLTAEVCSQCHPFYTGKQRIMDTGGRVARFEKRYGKRTAATAGK
jgi:large subunit ribosomal protein L31